MYSVKKKQFGINFADQCRWYDAYAVSGPGVDYNIELTERNAKEWASSCEAAYAAGFKAGAAKYAVDRKADTKNTSYKSGVKAGLELLLVRKATSPPEIFIVCDMALWLERVGTEDVYVYCRQSCARSVRLFRIGPKSITGYRKSSVVSENTPFPTDKDGYLVVERSGDTSAAKDD